MVGDYLRQSGTTLSALLITHHHSDHIGGIDALVGNAADNVLDGAAGNDTMTALKIISPGRRRSDFLAHRDVFLCYVMGPVGCGKSALLRSFLHRQFASDYSPTTRPALAVNSVEIGGRERYLVLKVRVG